MTMQRSVGKRTGLTWQVATLAGPLVLQNLSHTLLGVVDTFFVSRLGTEALAAVGLASVMFFAVLMLFRGIANSTIVFVGRAYGEEDNEKIGASVWRGLNMIVWLSLPVVFLPWIFSNLISFVAPIDGEQVVALGTEYLRIRSFEIPMVMFGAIVWGFLVGRGDSRTPMLLAWVTVLLNIFLDWVFVFGNLGMPTLGVAGAAYATVLANAGNAILGALILFSAINRRTYGTGRARFSPWSDLRKVLVVGLPIGLGDFIEIASFSAFFALIARLGTDILAANQIALQYMSVSFTVGIAVGMATSSLVAQYLGAKKPDLAEKVAYRAVGLAMIGMGLIGLLYLIAPEGMMRVFSDQPTVIAAGITVITLMAFYQFIDAIGIVIANALNGAGDTRFTMFARLFMAWGLFIPLVWVMIYPLEQGIGGAWIAAFIYLGSLAVVYYIRFRSGRWKTIEIG